MKRSTILSSALGAAFMAAVCASAPAQAIEPGCYAADVVRATTWNAAGPEQQFTIIAGKRPVDNHNPNVITSNADGSLGYNIESDPATGKLCIATKFTNARLNANEVRPAWVKAPEGSFVDRYLKDQHAKVGDKVIFGATTIVRGQDGRDYAGPQLLMTKAESLIEGTLSGAAITNDGKGNGDRLFSLMDIKTNSNFDRLLDAQQHARVQTASIDPR